MNEQLFQKILVATDFSESASATLAQAVWLAELVGAKVTVAHVIPFPHDTATTFVNNPWYVAANSEEIERRLRNWSDRRLRELIAPYHDRDVKLHAITLWGTPFIEIIQAVQSEEFDLLVAGTHGASAISRFFIGGTAARLVRKCPCPVWTIRRQTKEGLSAILAPIDFSEVSRKSLRLAAELSRRADCALHVLHVDTEGTDYGFDIIWTDSDEPKLGTRRHRRRRELKTQVQDFLRDLELSADPRIIIERGDAWKRILSTGKRLGADLTVLGTLGRAGVAGMVIGNTAEKVLNAADGSILAVKPDGFVSPVPLRAAAVQV
jgi:nucleotide-binding universal stress UspA family protein